MIAEDGITARIAVLQFELGASSFVTHPKQQAFERAEPMVLGLRSGQEVMTLSERSGQRGRWVTYRGCGDLPLLHRVGEQWLGWRTLDIPHSGDFVILVLRQESQSRAVVVPVHQGGSRTMLGVNLAPQPVRLEHAGESVTLSVGELRPLGFRVQQSTLYLVAKTYQHDGWSARWARGFSVSRKASLCCVLFQKNGQLECRVLSL